MRNRIIFGRAGLKVPTPLLLKAILKWVKRVCLSMSALSSVSSHEYIAFALVCLAWFVDEIEPLFGEISENKTQQIKPEINNPIEV